VDEKMVNNLMEKKKVIFSISKEQIQEVGSPKNEGVEKTKLII